jgi:hypothetical protein
MKQLGEDVTEEVLLSGSTFVEIAGAQLVREYELYTRRAARNRLAGVLARSMNPVSSAFLYPVGSR